MPRRGDPGQVQMRWIRALISAPRSNRNKQRDSLFADVEHLTVAAPNVKRAFVCALPIETCESLSVECGKPNQRHVKP